ncbi:MAG: MoaD/ThiS family protein [Anaerolineales bacterium]|nr:MoaD/ThiS family protein [Anaerolineales bacterium]
MKVTVRLFTILKKYGKGKIGKDNYVKLPVSETVQGLIRYLEIPENLGKVYLVNNIPRNDEYTLSDGDEVKILAFIGGG